MGGARQRQGVGPALHSYYRALHSCYAQSGMETYFEAFIRPCRSRMGVAVAG